MSIVLRLYISGSSKRSLEAIRQLKEMGGSVLPADHALSVIDVLKHPHLAARDQVLLTPTLILESSPEKPRAVGDFSDPDLVMESLGIEPGQATESIPATPP